MDSKKSEVKFICPICYSKEYVEHKEKVHTGYTEHFAMKFEIKTIFCECVKCSVLFMSANKFSFKNSDCRST